MATDYADELRKLAATLDEAKQEINLARQQSTKPKHLYVRARRAAVQAAGAVAAAVDLGFSDLWPPGPWTLSALRNPDDATRPPATFTFGGKTLQMLSLLFSRRLPKEPRRTKWRKRFGNASWRWNGRRFHILFWLVVVHIFFVISRFYYPGLH